MRNITRPDVTLASLIGFILSRQKYGEKCRIITIVEIFLKVKKKFQKNKIN